VIAALFIRRYLLFVTKVSAFSMSPLLQPRQRLLTRRLHASSQIQRGDIVIFYCAELEKDLIKRVIGLPGDAVDIRQDGTVYLNQKKWEEPYMENPGGGSGLFIVPKGKYFVLGDNRAASQDSRHLSDPYISKKDMVGKAFLSLFPLQQL